MNQKIHSPEIVWQLFSYQLPLLHPLKMLGQSFSVKKGAILRFLSKENQFGEGELAILPGVHLETLDEATTQLNQSLLAPQQNLFPSVDFALDMALSTFQLKNNTVPAPLKINGLAVGSGNELISECKLLLEQGFDCVKLKVGRNTIQEDVGRVKLARKVLGAKTKIRLDANRAWEFDEAVTFANQIKNCQIEYCEEPLKQPSEMNALFIKTGLPLALDETLWNASDPEEVDLEHVRALILKPGAIGGLSRIQKWVDHAKQRKKPEPALIFSSCFESGLGLNWIAWLASRHFKIQDACGLDTFKWFEHDLIEPKFDLSQARYIFPNRWPISLDQHLNLLDEGRVENPELLSRFSGKFIDSTG